MALGDSSAHFRKFILSQKMREFADGGLLVSKATRIYTKYGMHPGKRLQAFLHEAIVDRCGNKNLTFKQLHEMTLAPSTQDNARRFRDLYVVGTNLAQHSPVVFSWEDSPDLPIMKAVLISASIPVFFQAVPLNTSFDLLNASQRLASQSVPNFSARIDSVNTSSPNLSTSTSPSSSSSSFPSSSSSSQSQSPPPASPSPSSSSRWRMRKSKKSSRSEEGLYVDGGLCWNLPTSIFDTSIYTTSLRKPAVPPNAWMIQKLHVTNSQYVWNYDTLALSLFSSADEQVTSATFHAKIHNVCFF